MGDEAESCSSSNLDRTPQGLDELSDNDISLPHSPSWKRQPRAHFFLCLASLACVLGLYEFEAHIERVNLPLEETSIAMRETCLSLQTEAESNGTDALLLADDLTYPPPTTIDVLVVYTQRGKESEDLQQRWLAQVNEWVVATESTVRGRMLRFAVRASLASEVPQLRTRHVAKKLFRSSETVAVQSLADATFEQWTIVFEADADPSVGPGCRVHSNRIIWCSWVAEKGEQGDEVVTANQIRTTMATALGAVLGVNGGFRDHQATLTVLRRRQIEACRYCSLTLLKLSNTLLENPTMPLPRSLQEVFHHALDLFATKKDFTKAARLVETLASHPSLLPQMFFPLEHIVTIHLSFLLPLIMGCIAGLGATLKHWRATRRAKTKVD